MVEYKEQRIKIKRTEDYQVAEALAYLAGFPQGTVFKQRTPDHEGASRTSVVFHKETVAEDPDLFMATKGPDILVSGLLKDEYLIEFNERVNEDLVGKIEGKIREHQRD